MQGGNDGEQMTPAPFLTHRRWYKCVVNSTLRLDSRCLFKGIPRLSVKIQRHCQKSRSTHILSRPFNHISQSPRANAFFLVVMVMAHLS